MKEDNQQIEKPGLTRREVLVAGTAGLVGATGFGKVVSADHLADLKRHKVEAKNGGSKPVFVPESGVKDLVAHSVAENLFWNDILMEHAAFFVMLMPGPELATERGQAEQFKSTFSSQFEKAKTGSFDRNNYAELNRSTIELAKPFIEFKHKMREAQASGKLKSLVWPLFFEHTAREAERFSKRLSHLSSGHLEFDRNEVVDFWTQIMDEHARFIAHLLDPAEMQLIDKATKTSKAFQDLRARKPSATGGSDPVASAANEILDFKVAAGKGIQTGQIKSIIHPTLADHVRREAVKFIDELKRTGKMS